MSLTSRLFSATVFVLTLPLLALSSLQGEPGWRQGGPPGADVLSLTVDPTSSNIVYLVTEGSVWKSTDSGAHWFASGKNVCSYRLRQIAVDPARPATLYLAGAEAVYKSTDAGASWQPGENPPDSSYTDSVAVDPRGLGIVYRGDNAGFWRSTDSGMTWAKRNGGAEMPMITRIVIDPASPERIFALTYYSGVFRTTNGGSTWSPINVGFTTTDLKDIALSGDTLYVGSWAKGAFKSTDSGTSWTGISPDTTPLIFLSVAVHPTNPNIVFAGSYSGDVHRSTDGGAHWASFQVAPERNITSLVFLGGSPATLYAGGQAGFAVSTDSAAHWTSRITGLTGGDVSAVALDNTDPLTFYVGTRRDGLWRTTDGGSTWTSIGQQLGSSEVKWVTKVPTSNVVYAAGAYSGLYKTTDRGDTWVAVGGAELISSGSQVSISPANSLLYAVAGGVFVSSDGGATWANKSTGLPPAEGGALAFDPVDPQTLYVGYDGNGMFKTTNGGTSWTEIGSFSTTRIRSLLVDPWDARVVYAGADYGSAVSTDRGATWSAYPPGLYHPSIFMLAPGPNKTIFAATWQGTLFTTRDHGATWSEFKPRLASTAPIRTLAVSNTNGTILAGTEGGGVLIGRNAAVSPLYFPQVADGVAGTLKFRSTLVLVNGGDDTQATITFKNAAGQPMAIRLNDSPAQSVHTVNLKRRESVSLQTPGTDPIQSGYAIVSSGPQVTGTVVFSFYDNGVCMYESGVPATQSMYDCSLFFDGDEAGRDVGLALVNVSDDADAKITLRLLDTEFNQLAVKDITELIAQLGPGYHLARYATEIFPEIRAQGIKKGVVTVESDQPIAAVTLRQTDVPSQAFPAEVPTICTFPVIDRRAEAHHQWVSGDYFYFPQIANGSYGGAKYQTTLSLLNTGRTVQGVEVKFFSSDGELLSLPLKGYGEASSFSFTVERGHTLELQTTGEGDVKVGYARIRAPLDFGGTAVFTFWQNGVRFFEAGVPAVFPSRSQSVFLDNLEPGRDIGFAIVGASATAPDATLKLYDSAGTLKATREVTSIVPGFGAGDHLAMYAAEVFPEIRQQNIRSGIVAIESKEPVAAVTLRQHTPSQAFPLDIYLLTIFPVIPLLP